MTTRSRQRFIRAQLAWMLASILALSLLDELSLTQFFIFSLVGFLVLVEFLVPVNVEPRWRKRIRWLIVLGLLGFGYVVVDRFRDVLPEGVF